MKLQSCQNCWFNGLQYGSVGLSVGFCARHRKILNLADETTCGLHIRKDLGLARARQVAILHSQMFKSNKIVRLTNNDEAASDVSDTEKDMEVLRTDAVGEAAVDYGSLNSKIESLSQLKTLETVRSDIAMTSLGRAYVANCKKNGGRWTSAIHLYWWTKKRLTVIPDLQVHDLRCGGPVNLSRQVELAAWSVMMMKLTFLDDIILHAREENDELGRVEDVTVCAAEAVQNFNVSKLSRWIGKELQPALEARLSIKRYAALANELHREAPSNDQPV